MSAFHDIRRFEEIDSTNRWMRDAAVTGAAVHGTVAIADMQTAGRGRLDRRWIAPARSALLMSVLVDCGIIGLPADHRPMVSFCMALAVHDAANHAVGVTAPVTLKWPNDVIVPARQVPGGVSGGYRKLAGVLVEATGGRLVVGVGVNLVRPDDVDPALGVAASPVWLGELTDAPVDPDRFASAVLEAFSVHLDGLARSADGLLDRYRTVVSTIGWTVRVDSGGSAWTGRAVDIDDRGRLVVVNGEGTHHVDASEVVHVRPA